MPTQLLHATRRITMELSNYCNLASVHEACPASKQRGKVILPTDVVQDVVHVAGSLAYTGAFAWHLYNEPVADERLVSFCRLVKDLCPSSKGSLIWTNGDFLDSRKARCLWDNGVYAIRVSLYTNEAAKRMQDVAYATPFINWHFTNYIQGFDERLEQYLPSDPHLGVQGRKPCHAPLTDLTINHKGELILCCMDWRFQHVFTTVTTGFRAALTETYEKLRADQTALASGIRERALCVGCHRERPEDPNILDGTTPFPPEYPAHDLTGTTFDKRNDP